MHVCGQKKRKPLIGLKREKELRDLLDKIDLRKEILTV